MIQLKGKTKEKAQKAVAIVSDESASPTLTDKQQRFVEEYVVDLNATQSAIRAGYSPDTAAEQACRMLTKVNIRKAVESLQREISNRLGLTAERVLTEMSYLGFSNMKDYMRIDNDGYPHLDFSGITREQAAALSEVTVYEYNEGGSRKVSEEQDEEEAAESEGREVKRVKFKLHDKRAALVDLGRHMGLFKTASESEASVNADRDIVRGLAMLFLQKKANAIEV